MHGLESRRILLPGMPNLLLDLSKANARQRRRSAIETLVDHVVRKPDRVEEDAAAGRMPAYVDTGLNIVHVDDVAAGHLLAYERGRVGERYILGGEDMSLRQILEMISAQVGRKPPSIRLPYGLVLPMAYMAEGIAKLTGRSGRLTLEGVRMSRKIMFFSSAKAVRDLGYSWRPPQQAFADAITWFRAHGRLP